MSGLEVRSREQVSHGLAGVVPVLGHYPVSTRHQPQGVGHPREVRQLRGPGVGGRHDVQGSHPLCAGDRGWLSIHHIFVTFLAALNSSEIFNSILFAYFSVFDEILGFNEKCRKLSGG